ncbi:hypothetical protein TGME49_329200 [Toxoplasma gondii ME49]|uniref:Uncharacterized protein n=1 Tax=Toxoplasma gondii (strain ATCC 50611 / Me49) TaxID=508771 RepID=S8ETX9_TOXGM|nr:hypothetical protein TGME49_329200 [Toxoplasma gondii ME49]EPT24423.1 hypothetical protein TGME49_329200 [Toxoplasma gondii ME49]|eukprot:XP_018634666.1 hypothetical protein TGME49_329200 [Toxoplasma gondii ME49]
MVHLRHRFSPRYDITLARIVDVLGVAAPHGRAVVCCQEVVTVWVCLRDFWAYSSGVGESECPAWDAWSNPVAEANDPSSLVSEYAACGVWWLHTVLPFSGMRLVAYLRGWEAELRHRCSPRCRITLARIVDVLGVAAPHGPAVVWHTTRRVDAPMDGSLPVVGRYAVCLGDARALCSGAEESECPAWDAWANPVAEANDPSSLVSEYAACGVWWLHTVLPFSGMRLVAYLRGWASDLRHKCSPRCRITLARIVDVLGVAAPHGPAVVWYATRRVHAHMAERLPVVSRYAVCLGDARAFCSGREESECPAWDAWANPVAEANDPSSLVSEYAACGVWRPHTVLPFSRMSLVAYLRGWVSEVVFRRGCSLTGSDKSECPAWDAWANPVAEANDPSSLVSEYAACGVWRPHTVLPFSRMSLVAYLRGWAAESACDIVGRFVQEAESVCNIVGRFVQEAESGWAMVERFVQVRLSVCDIVGRILQEVESLCDIVGCICQAAQSLCEIVGRFVQVLNSVCDIVGRILQEAEVAGWDEGVGGGDSQRSDVAVARIVDVVGVAAPHGPALYVCLGDGRAYCPGAGGKGAKGPGGGWCVSWRLLHHVA